jgi:hypothetical protein
LNENSYIYQIKNIGQHLIEKMLSQNAHKTAVIEFWPLPIVQEKLNGFLFSQNLSCATIGSGQLNNMVNLKVSTS